MKKSVITLFLSLLLAALCVAGASAGSLEDLWTAGEDLLVKTDNATIEGTGTFTLDGKVFKTAEGKQVIAGYDSSRSIRLVAPREDDEDFENGYTIVIKNGLRTAAESYLPGIYGSRLIQPRNTIVRQSVGLNQMLALGKVAMNVADLTLADAVQDTVAEDGTRQITFRVEDEKKLAQANPVLNLGFQYLALRTRYVSFDLMSLEGESEINEYATVPQGILFSTRAMSLKSLDVTGTLDGAGRLTGLKVKAEITLTLRNGKEHALTVDLAATVRDYGTSEVPAFDPDTYNIPRPEYAGLDAREFPGNFENLSHEPLPDEASAIAFAMKVWALDELGAIDTAGMRSQAWDDGDYWEVVFTGALGEYYMALDKEGTVMRFANFTADYESAMDVYREEFSMEDWTKWRESIALKLANLAEKLNPGETDYWRQCYPDGNEIGIMFAGFGTTKESEGGQYLTWYGEPSEDRSRRCYFVVETKPELRVVYFDRNYDAMAGGNG